MRKLIIGLLACMLVLSAAACGTNDKTSDKPVAEKYHKLMDLKEGDYYLETAVTEQFLDDADMKDQKIASVAAEAIKGKESVYLSGNTSMTERQLNKGNKIYYINDEEKTYYTSKRSKDEAAKETYVKTGTTTLNGESYQYDQYQSEYEMTDEKGKTETNLYIKRYLVDDKGDLVAIRIYNQKKNEKDPFYRRTDVVKTFSETKIPTDIFKLPEGYKVVKSQ